VGDWEWLVGRYGEMEGERTSCEGISGWDLDGVCGVCYCVGGDGSGEDSVKDECDDGDGRETHFEGLGE
jgi:hypothetical protein